MKVSIELPDPPPIEPLLRELSSQYQDVLNRLMSLTKEANSPDRFNPVLSAISEQQDTLVSAFERMVQTMAEGRKNEQKGMRDTIRKEVATPQMEASNALISAIQGVKSKLSGLPDDLGSVMDKHFKSRQQSIQKQAPAPKKETPKKDPQLNNRLDRLEQTVLASRGSRNRTFGSNF